MIYFIYGDIMNVNDYFIFGMVIFLLIIVFYENVIKKLIVYKKKETLFKNNEKIIKLKEKLDTIISQNTNLTINYRIFTLLTFLMTVIAAVSFFVNRKAFNLKWCILIPLAILAVFSIIIWLIFNNYKKAFKNSIIKNIIKEYNPLLSYSPQDGFSRSEYFSCEFFEGCTDYHSEDMICYNNDEFSLAVVKTVDESTGGSIFSDSSDGKEASITTFYGTLASTKIKDIGCKILMGSAGNYGDFKKIKFNNDQYNKLLPTYSDNEALARKILTPDVIEKLVVVRTKTFADLDIRIINDMLYLRFPTGGNFVPHLFNKSLENKSIYYSLATIEEVITITEQIKNIIQN